MKTSLLFLLMTVAFFSATFPATAQTGTGASAPKATGTTATPGNDTSIGRGVAEIDKAAGSVSDTAGKVGDVGQGLGNIANADGSLGSINSALDGFNSAGSALDKLAGGDGSLWGESGELGKLTGGLGDLTGTLGGIQGEFDSVTSLVNNPEQLMQMALGGIDFDKITQIAMNVAEEEILGLIATPSTGIPVTSPTLQAQKAIEENIKKETSDIDKKIQEEKDKQLEAIGGKPATPAPKQTGTNNKDAEAPKPNPSIDDCAAYMAQFPPATSVAYDWVKQNVLPEGKNSKYAPGQKDWNTAVAFIKSNFYITDPKNLTGAEQKRITKKRQDYFYEVNANVISTAIGIQQGLVEDAESISTSPTSGCNEIDDININTQILMTLSKQKMAEIALQIRLLELEALREQAALPLTLQSEPKYEEPNLGQEPNPDQKGDKS